MCGPTGVGFLYGKSDILSARPAFLGGGEMVSDVFFIIPPTPDPPPSRMLHFGYYSALIYLMNSISKYIDLTLIALWILKENSLQSVPNVRIYGPAPSGHVFREALCYFNHGVAIRSGHHCAQAQPLHRHLGDCASAQASPHLYNTVEDIDDFTRALNDSSFFNSFKLMAA
ncbi:cysteine desulfurase 2 [Pyrus ussuriensis x Pyrus communis]|uniref:Cysteine desulfurase 2 n=1 Tax=Pyrus ussuriensis x Pyrus communis TaxID=2448454 RepID=A0A5N5FT83_9ROSA|nr:cysteine desulfurase 2 [Pyrus ussuriensis x Pyrus communis]